MTIKALYPTVRPTLNLDFAKTKALDPRVTFSRASTGTFVGSNGLIQTAASGAARFDHNPATGESLGLLMEEARTNLITYSEQFDNAAWDFLITQIASRTPNAAIAPNGTLTADRITAQAAAAGPFLFRSAGSAAAHTISCYVKKDTSNWFAFSNGGYFAWFNIETGALGTIQEGVATIVSAGNGWYKCSWTPVTLVFNDAWRFRITTNNDSSAANGESLFLWGAQLEAGSFPTSYIPTTTATVTRAAEVASMTGTNFSSWYRQDQGTIYQSVKLLAASPQDNQYYGATFSAVTDSATKVAHDYSSLGGGPSARTIILSDAGALIATLVILPFNATTRKTASAMQVGSVALAANGQIVTGTATAMPSTVDRMFLSKSGFTPNTTISRFAYYPVRLPDAQLQTITL